MFKVLLSFVAFAATSAFLLEAPTVMQTARPAIKIPANFKA